MNVQEEFLKAYDSLADAIFRHCYFRVYQHELAMDLMQQTFMNVWRYMVQGNKVDNLRALLYRTANNLVIDESRKRREQYSLELLEEKGIEPSTRPKSSWEAKIDYEYLFPHLQSLEDEQRQVIIMRYIDDLSPKEIAVIIGETANVVSVRLHRAIDQLRKRLPSSYAFTL